MVFPAKEEIQNLLLDLRVRVILEIGETLDFPPDLREVQRSGAGAV